MLEIHVSLAINTYTRPVLNTYESTQLKKCIHLSENQNGNGAFRLIRISSTVTANELLHPFLFWMRGVVFVVYANWHELFQPP